MFVRNKYRRTSHMGTETIFFMFSCKHYFGTTSDLIIFLMYSHACDKVCTIERFDNAGLSWSLPYRYYLSKYKSLFWV